MVILRLDAAGWAWSGLERESSFGLEALGLACTGDRLRERLIVDIDAVVGDELESFELIDICGIVFVATMESVK
jgi:hypothetical protein